MRTESFEKCLERVVYTKKVKRKEFLKVGNYPIISQEHDFINGFWDNPKDVFAISRPVIIFGDHTKVIKYVDFDFVIGADGVKILLPIKELNSKFFYYFLMSNKIPTLGYARHYRLLKNINVPIPPLPEQQRIVALLDQVFYGISKATINTEEKLNSLNLLKQSIVQKAFTGELTEG
jgi:type I restriction enzyme, S subunit